MKYGRRPFGKTLFAALLGVTVFVAPAFSSGTYIDLEAQANRFQAANGNSGAATIIVSVEDFENPALQGTVIEDVAPLVVTTDNPDTNTPAPPIPPGAPDVPGFHIKNPSTGRPPGAAALSADPTVVNLGDGLYGIIVTPGGGGWRSGNYVLQVRLVLASSVSHSAVDLCGINQTTITIP